MSCLTDMLSNWGIRKAPSRTPISSSKTWVVVYLSSASLLASASFAASVLRTSCCRACCCWACWCIKASVNCCGCECCDLMARGRGPCDVAVDARPARENAGAAAGAEVCLWAADVACDCISSCNNACCSDGQKLTNKFPTKSLTKFS